MTVSSAAIIPSVRQDLFTAAQLVEKWRLSGSWISGRQRLREGWRSDSVRLAALSSAFYTYWFAGAAPQPRAMNRDDMPPVIAAVRAAHAQTGRFDRGWTVSAIRPGGVIVAVRGDECIACDPPDYLNVRRRAAPAQPTDAVHVTRRRDHVSRTSGWWVTWNEPLTFDRMLKIYWNCGASPVARLVHLLTSVLESSSVPYMLKCPTDAELFQRTDPVVLYMSPSGWSAAKRELGKVHCAIERQLRAATPPLTLRLGRGVAIAEDPNDGRSFGQSRAQAVASGAMQAMDRGIVGVDNVIDRLAAALDAHGIDLRKPYLQPGSTTDTITVW